MSSVDVCGVRIALCVGAPMRGNASAHPCQRTHTVAKMTRYLQLKLTVTHSIGAITTGQKVPAKAGRQPTEFHGRDPCDQHPFQTDSPS